MGRDREEEEDTHVDGTEDDGGADEEAEAEDGVWAWVRFRRSPQKQSRKRGSHEAVLPE